MENTFSIRHKLNLNASPEKVFSALTTPEGLAGWWTPDTKAKPEVGSHLRFAFGPAYAKEMQLEELKPLGSVKWLCLNGYPDWVGTTLQFELTPHANGTTLFFNHDGWRAQTQGMAVCSYDWAIFLRSLKSLCETGKGHPYPNHYN